MGSTPTLTASSTETRSKPTTPRGSGPGLNSRNGTAVHGGLPQTLDLSHFDALRDYLIKYMDSPAFDGLAVMDFENWRPVFEGNLGPMRIYQSKSRELAHLLHPELNQTALQREAEMEFNHAARGLFEKSLEIGQELMPNAYWGYFYMPRIWGYDVHNTALINNKLDWLWNVSTALYPRIYMDDLNPPVITRYTNARYVRETLKEALRVKETFCRPNTPIYAFAKSLYGLSDLYDKADLDIGIGMAAQMGIDGVVVWGTSMYYRQAGFCEKQQAYVHDVLGPYVRNLTSFMKDCSHQLCSGHGRCVYNNFDSLPQPLPPSDSTHGATLHSRYQDYHCRCYFQWGGENCKTHTQSPCQPSHGHTSAPLVG